MESIIKKTTIIKYLNTGFYLFKLFLLLYLFTNSQNIYTLIIIYLYFTQYTCIYIHVYECIYARVKVFKIITVPADI